MRMFDIKFNRRFSVNPHRTLSLAMGEMSMHNDWVTDTDGDPYPILEKNGDITELVGHSNDEKYTVKGSGSSRRLLGYYFPWNTYELTADTMENSSVELVLEGDSVFFSVKMRKDGEITVNDNGKTTEYSDSYGAGHYKLTLAFHGNAVGIYKRSAENDADTFVANYDSASLDSLRLEEKFRSTSVSVKITSDNGECTLREVKWYISGGIAHADMKPIRYENGEVMLENGKVYMTMSSRCESGAYQSVISWNPTTAEFKLEGALFFDCGDGFWCGDVASSVIFNRLTEKWNLWVCAFSHGHILGHAEFENDPRHGVQVIDITLMDKPEFDGDDFSAKELDEDPDFVLIDGVWHLAICRADTDKSFHYFHFTSTEGPFSGYKLVDKTPGGEKTGGLFVKFGDEYYFVCGSDITKRAVYDICELNDFSSPRPVKCDYDDGGYRGWGTIMELPVGTRKQLVWMTFDRHCGSDYGWSYGNIYVFDSSTYK